MIPKYHISVWTYIASRRCLHVCQVGTFALLLFGLYISTSYYTMDNEKMLPTQDFLNESSYTETAILVNTESSNIIIQKQVPTQTYERPVLYNETVTVIQSLKLGNLSANCGLPKPCGDGTFSVHIYTGKDHKDEPRVCVDGKYILMRNINDGGRGINVVVVDSLMRVVIRVAHFDTYEKDSTSLETLLLTLRHGDIVILITFDEPSRKSYSAMTKTINLAVPHCWRDLKKKNDISPEEILVVLSRIARLLLFDLGSAFVQNLGYRGSWYLITQKGLAGFSPFEELHFVESNGWPKHHDVRFCVPFKISGQLIHPDLPVNNNPQRVQFCERYEDLPLFCDADVMNDPLSPSPVWKQPAAVNKIYDVPVIVMSGKKTEFLPLTLETLIRQPGIKPAVVAVYHLPGSKMVQSLSDLFGFLSEELDDSTNYCEHVAEAFVRTTLLFPEPREILFIGENAVLAPDFLYYMGQLLPILKMDPSILAISALNENGFKTVSGDPSLVYRTESFSGVALLVRKNFFKSSWCKNNVLMDPVYISSHISGNVVVPDVSRVTLAAPSSFADSPTSISSVFLSHDRTVTYEQNIALKYPEKLFVEDYEKELEMLLLTAASLELDSSLLHLCLKNSEKFREKLYQELPLFISNTTNFSSQILTIYFFQETDKDTSTVQYITPCLGLFYHPSHPVRGMYKGILRFMLNDNQAFLVGSKSPFFHLKSDPVSVLQYDHHRQKLLNAAL